jgi:hypothetical protein
VCGQNLPQSIKEQHPTNDYCCLLASDLLLLAVNCKFLVSAEPQIKLRVTKVLAKYASGLS